MFKLLVLTITIAVCSAQIDPRDAKILKEQRFNAGDGRAGAAFATEDGHLFREETDVNGDRVGEYSYIGDNGKTFTVKYVAGKDGFRVLDGAHIPSNGQGAAAYNAQQDEPVEAPIQVAQPVQQQVQARPQQQVQQQVQARPQQQAQVVNQRPQPAINDYDDIPEPVDPNRNPFVNPHDPTHRDFAFNLNGGAFAPKGSGSSLVPNCANCAGVNPFINPYDSTHSQAGLLAGHQAGFQVNTAPRPQPQQQQQQRPQQQDLSAFRTFEITTTKAPRFFPPGELKLNRFETGFNFDFSS